jgi:hypothetical protein
VRVAPAAEEGFDGLNVQARTRFVNHLSRLRARIAAGQVVLREGQAWALAAFAVGDPNVTLLAVGRRVELERRLRGQPR